MTWQVEASHTAEFLVSEAHGNLSRDEITVASGADLEAGTVLGKITVGAATPAADAGNTSGAGTIASVTVGAGAKAGVYNVICVEPATNAGTFTVEDPDGVTVGVATVAVEFSSGGLTFTITDATDFVAGDKFTITVADGSGKYVQFNPDGTDGRQIAKAILFKKAIAADADVKAVAVTRSAEVNAGALVWPADISADEKAAAVGALTSSFIIVRS